MQMVERIATFEGLQLLLIFQIVDVNPNNAPSPVPRFFYFMRDPFPTCGVATDQNHRASATLKLLSNPLFDCWVTAFFDALPVIVTTRLIAFNHAHAADLGGPPIVSIVVKTV